MSFNLFKFSGKSKYETSIEKLPPLGKGTYPSPDFDIKNRQDLLTWIGQNSKSDYDKIIQNKSKLNKLLDLFVQNQVISSQDDIYNKPGNNIIDKVQYAYGEMVLSQDNPAPESDEEVARYVQQHLVKPLDVPKELPHDEAIQYINTKFQEVLLQYPQVKPEILYLALTNPSQENLYTSASGIKEIVFLYRQLLAYVQSIPATDRDKIIDLLEDPHPYYQSGYYSSPYKGINKTIERKIQNLVYQSYLQANKKEAKNPSPAQQLMSDLIKSGENYTKKSHELMQDIANQDPYALRSMIRETRSLLLTNIREILVNKHKELNATYNLTNSEFSHLVRKAFSNDKRFSELIKSNYSFVQKIIEKNALDNQDENTVINELSTILNDIFNNTMGHMQKVLTKTVIGRMVLGQWNIDSDEDRRQITQSQLHDIVLQLISHEDINNMEEFFGHTNITVDEVLSGTPYSKFKCPMESEDLLQLTSVRANSDKPIEEIIAIDRTHPTNLKLLKSALNDLNVGYDVDLGAFIDELIQRQTIQKMSPQLNMLPNLNEENFLMHIKQTIKYIQSMHPEQYSSLTELEELRGEGEITEEVLMHPKEIISGIFVSVCRRGLQSFMEMLKDAGYGNLADNMNIKANILKDDTYGDYSMSADSVEEKKLLNTLRNTFHIVAVPSHTELVAPADCYSNVYFKTDFIMYANVLSHWEEKNGQMHPVINFNSIFVGEYFGYQDYTPEKAIEAIYDKAQKTEVDKHIEQQMKEIGDIEKELDDLEMSQKYINDIEKQGREQKDDRGYQVRIKGDKTYLLPNGEVAKFYNPQSKEMEPILGNQMIPMTQLYRFKKIWKRHTYPVAAKLVGMDFIEFSKTSLSYIANTLNTHSILYVTKDGVLSPAYEKIKAHCASCKDPKCDCYKYMDKNGEAIQNISFYNTDVN